MSRRVDFSRNANVYDRRHGSLLAEDVARRLATAADLRPTATILDVGAGTGRVAIALSALGHRVIALDPSQAMLHTLQEKSPDRPMPAVAGEGARLPFTDSSFDAVVLARVLYLMPDWRDVLGEAARVIRRDGAILHEWGNGSADEEWVQIREKARTLFEQAGVTEPFHPGARSEDQVHDCLTALGMTGGNVVRVDGAATMTVGDFLRRIITGEYSYTWEVPSEILQPSLRDLEAWTAEHFDLDRSVRMPRETMWKIYRKEKR